MPAGRFKSRTFRRVHVKTPGGTTVTHYKRRKPKKAHCARCGKVLAGTPHVLPKKLKKISKTWKRPERPYGGVLCGTCMKQLMLKNAQAEAARMFTEADAATGGGNEHV